MVDDEIRKDPDFIKGFEAGRTQVGHTLAYRQGYHAALEQLGGDDITNVRKHDALLEDLEARVAKLEQTLATHNRRN